MNPTLSAAQAARLWRALRAPRPLPPLPGAPPALLRDIVDRDALPPDVLAMHRETITRVVRGLKPREIALIRLVRDGWTVAGLARERGVPLWRLREDYNRACRHAYDILTRGAWDDDAAISLLFFHHRTHD